MDRDRELRRMAMRGVPERLAVSLASGQMEMRAKPNGTAAGSSFEFRGYAAVYDAPFRMWDTLGDPYTESVAQGACKRSLANPALDVPFLIGHDDSGIPLARTKSGTMQLSEDSRGLHVNVPSMDGRREEVRALASAVERGDMSEMSLAFVCNRQEWDANFEHRTVAEMDLHRGDVCAVTHGANAATDGISMFPIEQLSFRRPAAIGAPRLLEYRAASLAVQHGHPGLPCIDPDGDGDCDQSPAGDTDHDYWTADGKQIKPLPDQRSASVPYELLSVNQAERDKAHAAGNSLPDGCLAGETLVATRSGPRQIGSLVGPCEVLTDVGWEQAEIRSFGVKPLLAVTVRRGMRKQVIYATAGHRWLLEGGEWRLTSALSIGDRIPHVEVLTEGMEASSLNVSQGGIASDAEQATDQASHVVMVNLESSPAPSGARISANGLRNLVADRTSAALPDGHGLEVGLGNSVFAAQGSITPRHPAFVCDFDILGADLGTAPHAEAAVGTAVLPGRPDIEVGGRPLDAAGPAGDRAFMRDGHAARLLRWPWTAFGFSPEPPARVAAVAPASRKTVLGGLTAISTNVGHALNLTRSRTWEVAGVRETFRCEEVFCAVVPDLHRFVLASGVLTGNSYPINNVAQLHSAAVLAASHHGDWQAAQALIRRRAKELGVDVTTLPGFGEEKSSGQPLEHLASAAESIDLSKASDYNPYTAPSGLTCPQCGAGNHGGAKFCSQCSHRFADGTSAGTSANVMVDDSTGIPGEETQFSAAQQMERRLMALELEELAAHR